MFSCSAVKFISSISEPVLTSNIFLSWTHLETHQSLDLDLTDAGAAYRNTAAVIYTEIQGRWWKWRPNRFKTGSKVIARAPCLIGIIIVNWNHYSFRLRTSTLRTTGLEPWWSDNKPLFPLPPVLCLPSFLSSFQPSFLCKTLLLFLTLQSIMVLLFALLAVRQEIIVTVGKWTILLYSLLKYP